MIVMTDLGKLRVILKTGGELVHVEGRQVGPTLRDYWSWSASDLVSNATRGVLAEFIVATALGIPLTEPRDEWKPYDLEMPEGIKIEVKSAAFIQSWSQGRLSRISFSIRRTRGWSADTGTFDEGPRRQADVYVFALLAHTDKSTVDPLNVAQWQFFVVPTSVLDARTRSQHSITVPTLRKICGGHCTYNDLAKAVRGAGGQ
jgi:hypothetical protein